MENLIPSRVILLLFIIVNLFIAYGSNAVWTPISKKLVNGFYCVEAVLVTLFIIYDNVTTPLYDTLVAAIAGYFIIYLILALGYFSYIQWTVISPGKEYEAKIINEFVVMSERYVICCVFKDNYGKYSKAYIPIEQVFKEPENKEKDMTGLYKDWSVNGKLDRSYMKYQIDEEIKVKYKEYYTRQRNLIVDIA